MTFYKVNEGGVRSSSGIEVQMKHPDYLEYRDGGRSTYISIGYEPASKAVYIYASELSHWQRPDPKLPVSDREREEIRRNLQEGLTLLKGTYVVR